MIRFAWPVALAAAAVAFAAVAQNAPPQHDIAWYNQQALALANRQANADGNTSGRRAVAARGRPRHRSAPNGVRHRDGALRLALSSTAKHSTVRMTAASRRLPPARA